MNTGQVALVIVTHNTVDEVLGCLATVARDIETVVVDTGSHDGTPERVRRAFPHVEVLELANAGFGRGANAGVRATEAEFVIVANADVRFAAGSIETLADVLAADDELAAAGPTVRYPDGSRQASARRVPSPVTAVGHALFGRLAPGNRWTARYRSMGPDEVGARDADWLSGCALALRRKAFDRVGGFDPGFFLYVEDVDLCVRLRLDGWRLRYVPAAQVIHRVGASTSARRGRTLVQHARSLDRFCAKHFTGRIAIAIRPFLRVALTVWVVVTWALEKIFGGQDRSSTGERRRRIEGGRR